MADVIVTVTPANQIIVKMSELQGPQGIQGPTGPQGATGPQGSTGATGPAGVVAASGPITYDAPTQTVAFDQTAQNTTNDARYARLGAANAFTAGGHTITNAAAATIPLQITGATNQSVNLNLWKQGSGQTAGYLLMQDSSSATVGGISNTGAFYTQNRVTVGQNSVSSVARLTVIESSASTIPLAVRGTSGQTANLTEWQDVSGTIYAFVNPFGQLAIGNPGAIYSNARISVNTVASTVPGIIIRGVASQTANLLEVQNDTPTTVFFVKQLTSNGGQFGFASAYAERNGSTGLVTWQQQNVSGAGFVMQVGNAGTTGYIVKAAASQTANLTEWQDSTGTILARVDNLGQIVTSTTVYANNLSNNTGYWSISNNGVAQFVARNATDVPLTLKGSASQTSALTSWVDSADVQLARVDQTGSIRAGTFGAVASGKALMTPGGATNGFLIATNNAANVGLAIQASTSQTADLQQWKNSLGNSLLSVRNDGVLILGGSGSYINASVSAPVFFGVSNAAAQSVAIFKGAASQTANLQEWQDSAGSALSLVNSAGGFVTGSIVRATGGILSGTTTAFSSSLSVAATVSTQIGAVIRGAASQTANLTEWQGSGGSILASINAYGTLTVNSSANIFTSDNASNIILRIKGAASQAADALQIQNSAATILTTVSAFGALSVRNGGVTNLGGLAVSAFINTGNTANVGLAVQGQVNQFNNLVSYANSAATVLGGRNAQAQIFSGSTSPAVSPTGGATTAASGDGTTATITTTSAHGISVGQIVTVSGITPSGYNGVFTVTAVTSNTLSYANTTTGAQTVAGTVSIPAQLSIVAPSDGTTGVVVARNSSQSTANMLEIRDNAANVVSAFSPFGSLAVRTSGGAPYSAAALSVGAPSASVVATIIRGAASQTSNLTEYQDSSGAVLATINSNGGIASNNRLTVGSNGTSSIARLTVIEQTASIIPLAIRGAASQTANLQEWQNSSGTVLGFMSPAGLLQGIALKAIPGSGAYGTFSHAQAATAIPFVARAAASQSANLQEWQDSSGTVLSRVESSGSIVSGISLRAGSGDYAARLNVTPSATTSVGAVIRGVASQTANLQEWQDSTGGVLAKVTPSGVMNASYIEVGQYITSGGGVSDNTIYPDLGTGTLIYTNDAGHVGLTISGTSGQAVDLQRWNTSSGNAGGINASGSASFGTVSYLGRLNSHPTAAQIGLVVRGAASQTANLNEWQNSAGTILSRISSGGNLLTVGTVTAGSSTQAIGMLNSFAVVATNIGLVVRGVASQSANLQELQNSSGTVLGGRNAVAQIFSGSTAPITSTTGGATTAASGDGTTATITTTSAHGLAVGQIVTVAGVTPTGYNGTYTITAVTSTTLSYANTTTGAQTVAGTVSAPAQLSVTAGSAGTAGIVIRGAASQSGNLLDIQNSSASALVQVYSSGTAVFNNRVIIGGDSSARLNVVSSSATQVQTVIKGAASQTANLTEWQNSGGTNVATVSASGVGLFANIGTNTGYMFSADENSGGFVRLTKQTAAAANPSSGQAKLYLRDGTNAGTLKLVVRAGAAGAETTILDNIPQ